MSVFPDPVSAGGIVIRDSNGDPTNPANVQNAYVPPPTFITSCEITALPSDCNARVEPRQINSIVSELLKFAECLDPDGPWQCDVPGNLCNAFAHWASINIVFNVDGVSIIGTGSAADPYRVNLIDCGSW